MNYKRKFEITFELKDFEIDVVFLQKIPYDGFADNGIEMTGVEEKLGKYHEIKLYECKEV